MSEGEAKNKYVAAAHVHRHGDKVRDDDAKGKRLALLCGERNVYLEFGVRRETRGLLRYYFSSNR